MIRRRTLAFSAGLSLPLAPRQAPAQRSPWPSRPVTIVVSFAPGGAVDVIARVLAQKLGEAIGGSVVVESRVGGGGTVAAGWVARAQPDAHTLLLLTSGHAVNETLARNRGYDLLRDLRPVAQFAATPFWLVVPPARAASLGELLDLARREPLTFASGGPGGLSHLIGEMFRIETGLNLTHVPYRGGAPAISDLMAGRVDMLFDNSGGSIEAVRAGRLVALATTSVARLTLLPDTPTMVELGYPAFDVSAWIGLAVPAATDPALVSRLEGEVSRAMEDEGMRARLAAAGAEPAFCPADEFAAIVRADLPRWARVIHAGGITPD